MKKLNKKLALLVFSIGCGITLPAFAYSCAYYCVVEKRFCLKTNPNQAECEVDFSDCMGNC